METYYESLPDELCVALQVARDLPGLSGAELANVLNEAALEAVRRDALTITSGDVYNAMDRILEVGEGAGSGLRVIATGYPVCAVLLISSPFRTSTTTSWTASSKLGGHACTPMRTSWKVVGRVVHEPCCKTIMIVHGALIAALADDPLDVWCGTRACLCNTMRAGCTA